MNEYVNIAKDTQSIWYVQFYCEQQANILESRIIFPPLKDEIELKTSSSHCRLLRKSSRTIPVSWYFHLFQFMEWVDILKLYYFLRTSIIIICCTYMFALFQRWGNEKNPYLSKCIKWYSTNFFCCAIKFWDITDDVYVSVFFVLRSGYIKEF